MLIQVINLTSKYSGQRCCQWHGALSDYIYYAIWGPSSGSRSIFSLQKIERSIFKNFDLFYHSNTRSHHQISTVPGVGDACQDGVAVLLLDPVLPGYLVQQGLRSRRIRFRERRPQFIWRERKARGWRSHFLEWRGICRGKGHTAGIKMQHKTVTMRPLKLRVLHLQTNQI